MRIAHPFATILLFALGCGGETLVVGYDDSRLPRDPNEPVDLDAASKRCAAPPTAVEPSRDLTPNQVIAAGTQLLRGRWFRCPGTAELGVPFAFEIAADGAFTLTPHEGVFVRNAPLPLGVVGFSVRNDTFVIRYGDRDFAVTFQRNPMRMRWIPLDERGIPMGPDSTFVAN